MIRVRADDELLDIRTAFVFEAFKIARLVRPRAVVVADTWGGPHELAEGADLDLYTGDTVAHWTQPGLTGEIVETHVPRRGPRLHWIEWHPGADPTPQFADVLIRVTKIEKESRP